MTRSSKLARLPSPEIRKANFGLSPGRGGQAARSGVHLSLGRGRNREAVSGEGSDIAPITADHIIAVARDWLGTPYRHQASAKGQGTDCLGLIRGVWRALYGKEPEPAPPYTPDWNERAFGAGAEPLIEAARRNMKERAGAPRAGDVLIFRVVRGGPAKHCGILTGEARFIHAYAGRAVVESWLSRWWTERLAGVFVFPGAEE